MLEHWGAPFGAAHERQRQSAVDAIRQTTSEREGELQRIVEQAAAIAQAPIASVSIIETPRSASICNRVILRPGEPLVILDAQQDERYATISTVANPPYVRFYAGIPLVNRAGYALGALCVVDMVPRTAAPDLLALGRLAREAERVITGH